jgi:hypothetical protein
MAWNIGMRPIFEVIKIAVGLVGRAFQAASDLIGTVWARIKEKTSAPVRFVIDVVYTRGIKAVWDKVAGYVGLSPLPPAPKFATGGIMPGYTPGRDVHLAALSGGEAIMRPEWTRAVGPDFVHQMNATARRGGAAAVRTALGIPGYASGGIVGDLWDGVGKVADGALGLLARGGDILSQAAEHGFAGVVKAVLGPLEKSLHGVIGSGGFAGSIAAIPVKVIDAFIKRLTAFDASAGAVGGSVVGMRALNAAKSQLGVPYVFGGETPGRAFDCSGLTQWSYRQAGVSIPRLAHSQQNMAGNVNPAAAIPGDLIFFGRPAHHVGMYVSKNRMINAPHDGVPVQYDGFGGFTNIGRPYKFAPTSGGAAVTGAAQRIAMSMLSTFGWDVGQYPPLNSLWTRESGWNVHATNPTSGAYGIPQALPANKMAAAGRDWRDNPATQIRWGLGYIRSRYGSPAAAWAHSQRWNWYDDGGFLPVGTSLVHNATGKPEPVLTDTQWRGIQRSVAGRDGSDGPVQLVGDLYLEGGQFVGVVRGEVRRELAGQARAVAYGSRGSLD